MSIVFSDEYYMKMALAEAEAAFEKGEVPVGAVVVVRDKIIAKTHNLTEALNDVTAHAEMMAITSGANAVGGKYLKECVLYVTLEPCQMCAGAMYWAQLGKLVYGASDQQRGFTAMGVKLHPKTQVVSGVLEEHCAEIIERFFRQRRQ
ncbi:MAG: nucleoside deaminase [Bacteroidota bacterium]|nr:nucleoside deaminase [Bacteroidota bacterium]